MADSSTFAARTLLGSATSGAGAAAARVDVVVGRLGGPMETAWVTSLASGRGGHSTRVVELRPGLPLRPATLLVAALEGGPAIPGLVAGPAQAAVAGAIAKALEDDLLPREAAADLLVVVSLELDPAAEDADQAFASVMAATHEALVAAARGEPPLDAVLAEARHPWNAGYHRHRN